MPDPSVVPWWLCWVGCVLIITGLLATLHFSDQREPSQLARVSPAVVVLGMALLLAPPAINGGLMFFQGVRTMLAEAAARPAIPDADR